MGFRYRKSINLGHGFRINISKSGIGYSWGVKGARITKTARGTIRATAYIPGTGLSYTAETRTGHRSHKENRNFQDTSGLLPNVTEADVKAVGGVNAQDYQSAEYTDILSRIRVVRYATLICAALFCIFVFCFFVQGRLPVLTLGFAFLALWICCHTVFRVPMYYDFDDIEKADAYFDLADKWLALNDNKKFVRINGEASLAKKTSGGASRGIMPGKIFATNDVPDFLKTNIVPVGLNLQNVQVVFLPDKVLVVSNTSVGALNYDDIYLELNTIGYIETERVPSDATVIKQTWLKVNKDGSPDRRYKGNKQFPVCRYGYIVIRAGNSFHVEMLCSNAESVECMMPAAQLLFKHVK